MKANLQRFRVQPAGLSLLLALGLMLAPALALMAQSLDDFGYGNMTTKRAIPTAIILVNFTNDTVETTFTLPFKMGTNLVNANYTAAEQYYSNWFFGQTTSPETGNGYFNEISNGRFQWLPAGVYMVLMDTNDLHGAFMARAGGDGDKADNDYMNMMVKQAIAQGFDLASYDTNSVWIDEMDCTIQLITNDRTFGGGARSMAMLFGGSAYAGKVTIQRYNLGLRVLAEELIHVLQDGHCGDIYGPSEMSDGFSTMSGGETLHVDAWHKLQLAWCEPRIQSLRQTGSLTLSAAQLMDPTAPVILHDSGSNLRGTREFFVLEYRTTNAWSRGPGYDWSVADSGLVIWHVQQGGHKDPVNYTTTYDMVLFNWWRCSNCLGLFSKGPGHVQCCPLGGTNHVAEDGHLGLLPDNPNAEGVPGWRWCQKCGQMLYGPNVGNSFCAAGSRHLSDASDYRLRRDDDPEALGQRGWLHCSKCQSLYHPIDYDYLPTNHGICPAGGAHAAGTNTNSYTVLWTEGVNAMMTEGSPNLSRSRGGAWHSGTTTPSLRWFDGTLSGTRIAVRPFIPNAEHITIDILANYDAWVDFGYGGTEEGSFDRPFNTFAEGVDAVYPTGQLHIKTGVSAEKGHVNKAMKIEAYGGRVTLGHH